MFLKLVEGLNFFQSTMIFSELSNLFIFHFRASISSISSINQRNNNMFLHKATAAWYMQDRQIHMPADRLQQVQFRKT